MTFSPDGKALCVSHNEALVENKITADELLLCLQSELDIDEYLRTQPAGRMPSKEDLAQIRDRAQKSFDAEQRSIARGPQYPYC
jgi:hypothetical protein